jgi:hypothetical protein
VCCYVASLPFSGLLSQMASAFRQNATEVDLVFEEMFAHEQMIKIADGKLARLGILRLPVKNPWRITETSSVFCVGLRVVF